MKKLEQEELTDERFIKGEVYSVTNSQFFSVMFYFVENKHIQTILADTAKFYMHSLLYLGEVEVKDVVGLNYHVGEVCYRFMTRGVYVYSFTAAWFDLDYDDIERVSK